MSQSGRSSATPVLDLQTISGENSFDDLNDKGTAVGDIGSSDENDKSYHLKNFVSVT